MVGSSDIDTVAVESLEYGIGRHAVLITRIGLPVKTRYLWNAVGLREDLLWATM